MISVKLKKADTPTYIEYFDMLPTWDSLTSRIAKRYHIPTQDIAVGYLDNSRDSVTLTHNQGFQEYYKSLDQSSKIKLVVLDRHTPDLESPSVGSHLQTSFPLMQVEPQLLPLGLRTSIYTTYPTPSASCWVLSTPDADHIDTFSVDIGKEKTVDVLKKKIKQEQECTFARIDSVALWLWKLSPPISSVDATMLEFVKSPEEVPGCILSTS